MIPSTRSFGSILFDIALNMIMYLPFGYLAVRAGPLQRRSGRFLLTAVFTLALLFSAGMELCQLFNSSRYPTLSDVVMNVTGAVLGGYLRLMKPLALAAHR